MTASRTHRRPKPFLPLSIRLFVPHSGRPHTSPFVVGLRAQLLCETNPFSNPPRPECRSRTCIILPSRVA